MTEETQISIENIVGSGELEPELDLAAVAEDLRKQKEIKEVKHSREGGNRLLIYFKNSDALSILSPNSTYIFNGVNNFEKVKEAEQKLLGSLAKLDIVSSPPLEKEIEKPLEIQNLVCTGDLNRELNLEALSIGFGLESVEYEPEQFPGLIYRPKDSGSTVLLFASGKAVVTGVADKKTAQEAFDSIKSKVTELFD